MNIFHGADLIMHLRYTIYLYNIDQIDIWYRNLIYHNLQALSLSNEFVEPLASIDQFLNPVHQCFTNFRQFSFQSWYHVGIMLIVFILKRVIQRFFYFVKRNVLNSTYHYLFQRFREIDDSQTG